MKPSSKVIDEIVTGYVVCLLWVNAVCNVDDCEPGNNGQECKHVLGAHTVYTVSDIAPADLTRIREEIIAFVESCGDDFSEYLVQRRYSASDGTVAEHFGHDFALTRNGHGVGFWDRGLGSLGDRLTDLATSCGESEVLIGEDSLTII